MIVVCSYYCLVDLQARKTNGSQQKCISALVGLYTVHFLWGYNTSYCFNVV